MYLKKSMLALAITMVSSGYVFAETANLNDPLLVLKSSYDNGLDVIGSKSGVLKPFAINSIEVEGDLNLRATLFAEGEGSVALEIKNTLVDSKDGPGQLTNNAAIDAVGTDSVGLDFVESVADSIHNFETGSIGANGDDSTGLHISGSDVGGIINDGLISGGDVGLDLDSSPDAMTQSTIGRIDNDGVIQGGNVDSRGLLVDGAKFYSNENHVVNNGIIKGGKYGIEFDQFQVVPQGDVKDVSYNPEHLQVHAESGIISGGEYAIYGGDGRVDLYLGNQDDRGRAEIYGDLEGLGLTKVVGPSTFAGTSIGSKQVVIADGGLLTLQSAHTNITGDFTLETGGALGLPLSEQTLKDKPVLNVDGKAVLEAGSTLVINSDGADFAEGGVEYDLITANGLDVSEGINVQTSSALLSVDSFRVEDGSLLANVSVVSDEDAGEVIEIGGGDANTKASTLAYLPVAQMLASTNPDDVLLNALIAAGNDPEAIAAVAKQLNPEVNGGAATASSATVALVSNAISARSANIRSGMSSGDTLKGTGVWFQVLSSKADQDVRSGVAGYDADSSGFAIGADKELNANTVAGLAYSYVTTDVDSDTGNKTEVDNHNFTAYGTWTEGNYFVDGGITYGFGQNDSKRYIVGQVAKADYDSELFGVNLTAGYGFNFDNGILVEPRVVARYTNLSIDSMTEKGASSGNLSTGSQRIEVGDLGAGVRVAGAFPMGKGSFEPEAKLMAYHDVIGDSSSATSAFVLGGNSFVTTGPSPARDSYELSLGGNYKLGAVTVGASYDRLMKTGFSADAFTAKVRYDF